jgi:Carboxypeptidase regulatory-like domain/TonB-dependent Receptor Plug Domain/TonB dependent receptor
MQNSFLRSFIIAVVAVLAATLSPRALAQVTTSGMSGLVRTADGKPVSGASVTAVYSPTNTTYKAVTNADGRYYFRSLPVGGPYVVTTTADGLNSQPKEDITTNLGQDIDVDFTLQASVVTLEKFTVTSARNALDANATGSVSLFTRAQVEMKSSTQRSFADLVSVSPSVTLRSLSGDREEAQITALGQNSRYNSVMLDGNRLNDQFGLNASGLASFFNPISFDTIEQYSVITETPDVRYSGFTGATINFVTKTGTNDFHGSASYIFSGDHLFGLDMQGPDARRYVATGFKNIPHLEKTTKSYTLGGPIWKDHIFFFLNYEKLERIGAPNSAGLPGLSAADKAIIDSRVAQITKVNFGQLGGNANSVADEEKKLAKIDWRINSQHTLSARYSSTEGQVPQFGSFTTTSLGTGSDVSPNTIVGGATTAYDSHFYAQQRKEKSYSAQLDSQWLPDFSTELKWSHVKQDQYTPTAAVAPEIDIFGVTGVNQQGVTVNNGVVVLGTERFRHGNQINVDTKNYNANADYRVGNVTYSAGVDMEDNNYYNLFRQYSYGVFNYASPTAFLNDTPISFQRNFTDLAIKGGYADVSQYTQSGVYAKAKWDYSSRLNFTAGIRYDWSSSDTRPVFNQQFFTDTGMRNDGTVDGATDVSPRVGFNWSLDEARKTQIRGTAGYYVGRAPWVFWSNAYGQTGLGTYTVGTIPTGGLTGYLANSFDPANPLGTGTQTGTSRSEIDLVDNKTHMPSLWRMNLAVDHQLSFLDTKVSLDLHHSINDNTLFITNDNLKVRGTAADGRVYFFGNPSTLANAKYANYTNIFHTSNVKAGEASYATVSWERPMKNLWGFTLSYTRGKSTEAQSNGQTTASGAWQRNAVFNQGSVETGRADYEEKDRVQASITRQFYFIKGYKTAASLYYEGRTGAPYSFAYSGDMNADGFAGNDLVSVPTSLADPRFDFTSLSAADQAAMMAFFQTSGLSKYAGSYAPKNAFYQPWINRLDLKLTQNIPLHFKSAALDLFLDFTNFGNFISKSLFNYVERAPSNVNDVFDRRLIGNASITPGTGVIKVTSFSSANAFLIDDVMSRWRIQLGAKLSF